MRLHNSELSVWIAPIEDSTTIPVELNNFTAEITGSKVILSWKTATETNNQGFFIERKNITSAEINSDWIEIGFKEEKGNSTEMNQYQFADYPLYDGTYHYRLKQLDFDGSVNYSNEIEVNLFTVKSFALYQNYPNPFNPATTISFQLPEASYVTLKIYDAIGNEIETIAQGDFPAGVHEVIFDSKKLSSGIYLYRIISGMNEATRKMMVVK